MVQINDVEEKIRKTLSSLFSSEWRNNVDGGWGSESGSPSNLWSTAEMASLLLDSDVMAVCGALSNLTVPARRETDPLTVQKKAIEYVEKAFIEGAGYGKFPSKPADVVSTAYALDVLNQVDGMTSQIDFCLDYLKITQGKDGGWCFEGDPNLESDGVTTTLVCLAVSKTSRLGANYTIRPEILEDAYAFFGRRAIWFGENSCAWSTKGNAPNIRATAYVVYALKRIWREDDLSIPGSAYLLGHQNRNGSWGRGRSGEVEDTAWAIGALLSTGSHHKSNHITKGVEYLLESLRPTRSGLVGCQPASLELDGKVSTPSTLYALRALFWYKKVLETERKSYFRYILVNRVIRFINTHITNIFLSGMLILGVLSLVQLLLGLPPNIPPVIPGIISIILFAIPIIVALWRSYNKPQG